MRFDIEAETEIDYHS